MSNPKDTRPNTPSGKANRLSPSERAAKAAHLGPHNAPAKMPPAPAAGQSAPVSPLSADDAATAVNPAVQHNPAKASESARNPKAAPLTPTAMPAAKPAHTATPAAPAKSSAPTAGSGAVRKTRRTRKARLRLAQIDPWSAMKTTFLFSFAFLIAALVGVAMIYLVVQASGLFDSLNSMVSEVLATPDEKNSFRIEDVLSFGRVIGFTAIVGALNVVLMTTIGTLGAFLYNLAAAILGGFEVTLAED